MKKKLRRIRSIFEIEKWLWNREFCCFPPSILKRRKAKNIFMAIFIVLWPYLLTTKLRCLQKNNIGHTKEHIETQNLAKDQTMPAFPAVAALQLHTYCWSWCSCCCCCCWGRCGCSCCCPCGCVWNESRNCSSNWNLYIRNCPWVGEISQESFKILPTKLIKTAKAAKIAVCMETKLPMSWRWRRWDKTKFEKCRTESPKDYIITYFYFAWVV